MASRVAPVRSLPGSIEIRGERALVGLHDLVPVPARGHASGEAEGEHPRDARAAEHGQRAHVTPGTGRCARVVRRSTS